MRATAVSEWLGHGRYRITGEVALPVAAGDAHAYLTKPELIRRWALGGKVSTRLTEEDGLYVFTFRTGRSAAVTMRGEVLADEPRRVARRYRDARPGVAQERLVTYLLDPVPAGTLVRCEMVASVPGLGRRGGDAAGRAEAASLAHSLGRLALLAAGQSPSPWSAAFFFLFPKAPLPV